MSVTFAITVLAGGAVESRKPLDVVRIYRLGEEPRDDMRQTSTAEERLHMLRLLTERAWALTGQPLPSYSRNQMPVRVTTLK